MNQLKLTDEELRVLIAKDQGWNGSRDPFPDYSACLNAMAQARQTLTEDERCEYAGAIVIATKWEMRYDHVFAICDATPRQHAIAYVIAKNLADS